MLKFIGSLCSLSSIALVFVLANMGSVSDADETAKSTSMLIEQMNIQIDNVQHNVDVLSKQMNKIDEKYSAKR